MQYPPSRYPPPYPPAPYVPPPGAITPRRNSLPRDIYRGAVYGDFAPEKGIAGNATQALLGYVPGIGTLCALRDAAADIQLHDGIGVLLNVLAMFPVLGGVPKTIRAIYRISRRQRTAARRQSAAYAAAYPSTYPGADAPAQAVRRAGGCRGFAISLGVLAVGLLYAVGVRLVAIQLRDHGLTFAGMVLNSIGAVAVPLALLALGLVVGEAVAIRNRSWLVMVLLPVVLLMGFVSGIGGA